MFARVIKHVSGCQSGILSPLRPIMMMQIAKKSVKWFLIFLKLSQEYQKSNNKTFFSSNNEIYFSFRKTWIQVVMEH